MNKFDSGFRIRSEQTNSTGDNSLPKHEVAIVMPVYNAGKFLRKTVQAIIDQDYQLWRLWVVDDGSTDDSVKILESFNDIRISFIKTNGGLGPAEARNKAISRINAYCAMPIAVINEPIPVKYLAYCDADDTWTKDHLRTSVTVLQTCDMVYSDCDFEDERGNKVTTYGVPYYDEFSLDNLNKQNFIYISTVVHKRELMNTREFDKSCVPMEDYDMWLRLASSKGVNVKHIKKVMTTYLYKDGGSYYTNEQSVRAMDVVHKKHSIKPLADKLKNVQEEPPKLKSNPETIEGWLTVDEGKTLRRLATDGVCLEIGSYKGKSACYIAETAYSLVCVDPFKADGGGQSQQIDYTTLQEFLKNTSGFNNVKPMIGTSSDMASHFQDGYFDMIFVDGMHDYMSVMDDIKNYWPKLKVGGSMCFHDYQKDWTGVIQAVDETFGQPDSIVDSIAVVTKMSNEVLDYKGPSKTLEKIFSDTYRLMRKLNLSKEQVDKIPYFEFDNMVQAMDEVERKYSDLKERKLDVPEKNPEQKAETRVISKVILIAPWSHKLPNGKENPKNFPLDTMVELTSLLKKRGYFTIQIGVSGEPLIGADEIVLNASFSRLKELLDKSDLFLSVDSFFPHFANHYGRHGVVLFSQSDPKLFGYDKNLNILKSKSYLRANQFWLWTQCEYNPDAFVSADEIVKKMDEKF